MLPLYWGALGSDQAQLGQADNFSVWEAAQHEMNPHHSVQPPGDPDRPFRKAEKIKQQIADSDRGKAHERWRFQPTVFAPQVFHTALLTGLSVSTEAGQNTTAGTFTFQSHALTLVKETSHEPLNGRRQCFTHRC